MTVTGLGCLNRGDSIEEDEDQLDRGHRHKNDEGTWQGIPNLGISDPDGSNSTRTSILVGTGAYEGLTAVAEISLDGGVWDWNGWIIDGEILPAPAPPAEPNFQPHPALI